MTMPLADIMTDIEMIAFEIFIPLKAMIENGGYDVEIKMSWNNSNITIYSIPSKILYIKVLSDRIECGNMASPTHVFDSHDPEFFEKAIKYGQSEIVKNSVV